MAKTLPFDVNFTEAQAFLDDKIVLTEAEAEVLGEWASLRGFTVAGVTRAEILNDLLEELQALQREGKTLADLQAEFGVIMEARGWSGVTPWRAETIMRTNIQTAYGAGRIEQMRGVADTFPFWHYHAIGDSRTRPSHKKLDGIVQPADAPFWKAYYPPWDYNCRCSVEPLTDDEAATIGVGPVSIFDPPPDDDFTSPAASIDYRPDLTRLDPELAARVSEALASYESGSDA